MEEEEGTTVKQNRDNLQATTFGILGVPSAGSHRRPRVAVTL